MNENRIILTNGTDRDYLTRFDEISNPRQIIEINGASTLEFQLERNDPKWRYFEKPGTTAECNNRVYCIIGDGPISRQRDMSGTHLPVVMKEIWYKLDKKYITAYNIDIAKSEKFDHIDQHMVVLWGNSSDPLYINGTRVNSTYTVGTAQYFFDCLLYGSGWTLDTRYANYWPDGKYDLDTDKKSVLENINLLQTLFGGMLFWDSVGKRVALVDEDKYQVYEGFEIRYRKNLVSIERKEDHDIITRLYPYGNSHLNIAAVNGNREYVDNFTYTSEVLEGILTHNDIYNQEYLLAWGNRKLKTLSRPRYSYDVDLIRYTEEVGVAIPQPEFGKLAEVFDEDIVGDPVMQRITKIDQHVFVDYDCNVSVGDIANTFEGTLKDIQGGAKKAEDTISGGGKVPGVDIEGNIPQLDKEANNIYNEIKSVDGNLRSLVSQTAYEIRTEVQNVEKGLQTTISQTAAAIRLEAVDMENRLSASITITAKEIRQEVASVDGRVTKVSQTVDGIYTEVYGSNGKFSRLSQTVDSISTEVYNGAWRSTISQNSSSIALVVSGTGSNRSIRAAEIVASINKTGSSVLISADKVQISGTTTFKSWVRSGSTTIDGGKIYSGSITATQIASNAITSVKISSSAITSDKIASDAITANKIQSGAITSAKISSGAITSDKIAAGAITSNMISSNAVISKFTSSTSFTCYGMTFRNTIEGTQSGSHILAGRMTCSRTFAYKNYTVDWVPIASAKMVLGR